MRTGRPRVDPSRDDGHNVDIPVEYMPATELQSLHSPQYGMTIGEAVRQHTEGRLRDEERGTGRYPWELLHEQVSEHGVSKPLAIGYHYPWDDNEEGDDSEDGPEYEELRNGNHRAIVALQQGHLFVPVRRLWDVSSFDEGQERRIKWDVMDDPVVPVPAFNDRRGRRRTRKVHPGQGTLF
jgi:hypothetical protein